MEGLIRIFILCLLGVSNTYQFGRFVMIENEIDGNV